MINLETKIKGKLKEQTLTIEKLAVYSGVTKQTIHNIFKKNDIKLSHLERIAEVLHVNVNYFFADEEKTSFTPSKDNELELELNGLKRENDLLRQMMEILKQKDLV